MEHFKSRIPQAPWVLYFDGASRKPAAHGALGIVLGNNKGQIVEEERKFLGAGISSGLAKYKALLVGLRKAKSLQVKHLLAKCNSRILINQVVGRWTARDAHLRDHLKKVWVMSKEFDSLFMEFIPKEHNVHADRIANAAIDKELQIQEVVSNYFDRSNGAWQHGSPQTEPTPARILSKLRPVSPPQDVHCKNAGTIKSATKASARNVSISLPRVPVMSDDMQTSDSELTRTIESLATTKADRFWADRLSISDEASTSTASEDDDDDDEEEGYCRSSLKAGEKRAPAAANGRGSGDDSGEDQAATVEDPAPGGSQTIQLSEADCDRLVEAVIERLKKTRVPNSNDADSHS